MAKIQLNEFKGIMPKLAHDKLPLDMCQVAADIKTASKDLVAYRRSTADVLLPSDTYQSLFEYLENGNNNWVYYNSIVHWVRSPVADDTYERMYLTGVPGAYATGLVTFTDGMTDGEIITIGTEVFEFDIAEDGIGGDTSLGDSTTITDVLCSAALAATTPASGATLVDNLDGTVTVTAGSIGTAGNLIALTESGAHITVSGIGYLKNGLDTGAYKAFVNDRISGTFDFDTDIYQPGAPAGDAPTLTPGTPAADYVAYFYTYVSRYGEEGPPSAIVESAAATDDTRNDVDDIEYPESYEHLINPSVDPTFLNRPYVNLYRTVDTGAGSAAFLHILDAEWFDTTHTYVAGEYVLYGGGGTYDLYECTVGGVGSWAGGTHTFVQGENVLAADAGDVCSSIFYDEAPNGLSGLRGHPNGFFVAFKNNVLYFSEPYAPWAWPEDYQIPIDQEIIGLGIFGSTIVVCTDGFIYTFAGPHPTALYKTKLSFNPCLSQRAIVESSDGVMFPTLEGFQLVNSSGVTNVTQELFKPEDWVDYELETMHGHWYNKAYYGFYESSTHKGHIIIDFLNGAITTGTEYHQAGHVALLDGIFRTIFTSDIESNTNWYISRWNADTTEYRLYSYKSPRFILEKPANFKVAQVILDSDFLAIVNQSLEDNAKFTALNAALFAGDLRSQFNGFLVGEQQPNGDTLYSARQLGIQTYVNFQVYVDGEIKLVKQVYDSDMFKLPRGFKDKKWEIVVEGMIPVKRIIMATSTEEIV